MCRTAKKNGAKQARYAMTAGALCIAPVLALTACGEEEEAAQEAMTLQLSSEASSSGNQQPDPTEASQQGEPTREREDEDDAEDAEDEEDLLARCDDAVVQQSPGFEDMVVNRYCDGTHMEAGVPHTDHLVLAVWADGEWQTVRPAGTSPTNFPCFDADELETLGFPNTLIEKKPLCKDD